MKPKNIHKALYAVREVHAELSSRNNGILSPAFIGCP
jgi:hypothetical protein